MAEVLQGFARERDFETALNLFATMAALNLLNPSIAIKSARNYRILRKQGITIRKTVDSIIATFCIENRLPLLHSDRDFLPYQEQLGLRCII